MLTRNEELANAIRADLKAFFNNSFGLAFTSQSHAVNGANEDVIVVTSVLDETLQTDFVRYDLATDAIETSFNEEVKAVIRHTVDNFIK